MKDKLDDQVTVYMNTDGFYNISKAVGNSFKSDTQVKMKYADFLSRMNSNDVGVTMKESGAYDKLKEDIGNPSFMKNIMEPIGADII